MQLSVRLVPVGETTLVIALTGELDSTTRPVLAALLDPLPRSPVKYVVVAAADLWFCDLNGLQQLAITHQALRGKGGHLAVAEARSPLRRLVTLMAEQARPSIPLYTSMPEALAATGLESYETLLPRRHLPRLHAVRTVPSTAVRDRPRIPRDPDADGRRELKEELDQAHEELQQINRALTARSIELDEVTRLVSSVVRSLGDAVVVLNAELRVIVWSRGAEELWGVGADEAVGGAFASLDIGLPLESLMPCLRAALAGEIQGTVLEAVNRRGLPMPLAVRLSRLRTEDDEAHGLIMAMNVVGPDASPGR